MTTPIDAWMAIAKFHEEQLVIAKKKLEEDEEGQICHVHRHDNGGSYSVYNLVFGHKGCDGVYDNEHRFIHSPRGDYYLAKKYYEHKPDMKQ